ncbi:hypothetical protein ACIQNT_18920 [Streptomyces luteogriseus]
MVITVLWVELRTLLLWVLLGLAILTIQQLFQGLREAKQAPGNGRK